MSCLSLCLLFGVALASAAQIAPSRHRRYSDPSTGFGNNLLVEVSERALNAGIQRMRPWLTEQLYDSEPLSDFKVNGHIVRLKARNIRLSRVDLGDLALKVGSRGSINLEFPSINMVFESEWNYTSMRLENRGNLTVNINDTRLDLVHLVPKTFSGKPFIVPNIYCHAVIESLTINFGEREGGMKLYNYARPEIRQHFRKEAEKLLCHEAVYALEEFLRDGVMHLSLQHLIYGRHLLDYSVVADPQLVGTSLVLKHSGQIDEQEVESRVDDRQMLDDDWMVKYSIHPNLINQMLIVMANASAFDKNITVRNVKNSRIHLKLTTPQPPTVTIGEQSATLNIVSQWNVRIDENDGTNLSIIHSEDFALEIAFDDSAQLKFKLALTRSSKEEANNDEETDRAMDSKRLFLSTVHQHYGAVIARSLLIPLPKYRNTTVIAGHAAFLNGLLLFGADFASSADATVTS